MNSIRESYLGRPGRKALDFSEDKITQTKTLQALNPALLPAPRHGLSIGGDRNRKTLTIPGWPSTPSIRPQSWCNRNPRLFQKKDGCLAGDSSGEGGFRRPEGLGHRRGRNGSEAPEHYRERRQSRGRIQVSGEVG